MEIFQERMFFLDVVNDVWDQGSRSGEAYRDVSERIWGKTGMIYCQEGRSQAEIWEMMGPVTSIGNE